MNYSKRIQNLQKDLLQKNIDLLILDDSISLIYLTGLHISFGKLFILKDKVKLFVDGRYIQAAKEKTDLDIDLINEKAISDFIVQNNIKNISFDSSIITYHSFERLKSFLAKIKNNQNHLTTLSPLLSPLKEFRAVKDLDEISVLKKAASITWKGFEHICLLLKEGMSEKEVALEFEIFVKKNGADSLSFSPIVCFGKNSAKPHHMPSNAKLKLNDIVLMDVGVKVNDYNSDMTRVVFFGKPDPTLEKIYAINKTAQANALSVCRPGHKLKDLDLAARQVLKQEGYEKEFVHSLGHGVGLEIHEFPRIKFNTEDKDIILKPGMVITIEPGIYIPDLGGVRYEDMIVITNDGYENFYR